MRLRVGLEQGGCCPLSVISVRFEPVAPSAEPSGQGIIAPMPLTPDAFAPNQPCPCGRLNARRQPLSYAQCCAACHAGVAAPDAESLMRSRYSAFVLGRVEHLRATWHPSTCPAELTLEPGVKWLGLEVRDHLQVDEGHAEVEFVARSRVAGRGQRLHERSRFVRENGRWLYVDGTWL